MATADTISEASQRMRELIAPEKIILFNKKMGVGGKLLSFKVCIIIPNDGDKDEVERKIYVNTETDIPFDVVIYTVDEWDEMVNLPHSFASQINETGCVIYG